MNKVKAESKPNDTPKAKVKRARKKNKINLIKLQHHKFRRTPESVRVSVVAQQLAERRTCTLLNSSIIEDLCHYLGMGHYPKFACAACGISVATFHNWLEKGKRALLHYQKEKQNGNWIEGELLPMEVLLVAKVDATLADVQSGPLHNIKIAGDCGDWRASVEFLQRRFPKEWAKQPDMVINNKQTLQAIIISPDVLEGTEEWDQLMNKEAQNKLNETIIDSDIDSKD